jgi:hypothetical protein
MVGNRSTSYPHRNLELPEESPLCPPTPGVSLTGFETIRDAVAHALAINSNLGTEVDIDRLLASTQGMAIDLYTSNEAISSQAEYIRDGLVWDDWANNVERLLDSGQFRGIHVMATINALCLSTLDQLLECIMNWKLEYGKDAYQFHIKYPTLSVISKPIGTA